MPRHIPSTMTSSMASLKQAVRSILSRFFFKKSIMHRMSRIERAFLLRDWNFSDSLALNDAKKFIILKIARAISFGRPASSLSLLMIRNRSTVSSTCVNTVYSPFRKACYRSSSSLWVKYESTQISVIRFLKAGESSFLPKSPDGFMVATILNFS